MNFTILCNKSSEIYCRNSLKPPRVKLPLGQCDFTIIAQLLLVSGSFTRKQGVWQDVLRRLVCHMGTGFRARRYCTWVGQSHSQCWLMVMKRRLCEWKWRNVMETEIPSSDNTTHSHSFQFRPSVLLFFFFSLDAGLLARSQYSEGPATGQLVTSFCWFPCV